MSLYKGHIAGGVFAFIIYLVILAVFFSYKPTYETLIWFGLCILGSIWPDIDTSSTAQKLFYGFFLILDGIFLLAGQFTKAAILGFFCAPAHNRQAQGMDSFHIGRINHPLAPYRAPGN